MIKSFGLGDLTDWFFIFLEGFEPVVYPWELGLGVQQRHLCSRMARGSHRWNWRLGATFHTLASATDAWFFFFFPLLIIHSERGFFFSSLPLFDLFSDSYCTYSSETSHISPPNVTLDNKCQFGHFLRFLPDSFSLCLNATAILANTHKSYHGRTVCSHCP